MPAIIIAVIDILYPSHDVTGMPVKAYLFVLKLLFSFLDRAVFCWQYFSRYPTVFAMMRALR